MIQQAVYRTYSTVRWMLRTTGMIRPFRMLLGPIVGRLVFRISRRTNEPVEILGHQVFLASSGGFPPMAMVTGNYEPQTTKLFESLVEPGMIILDIGGHVGYYSLLAARKAGTSGMVYTFEPEPSNFGLLTKNAEKNGYSNIVPINKAASRTDGTTNLHLSALDNGRHSVYDHKLPSNGSQQVETISVDSFLEHKGWPRIGLVKIDVEGAEVDVLEGMSRLLSESSELKLIIEFNPCLLGNAGIDPHVFLKLPAKWGFIIQFIDEDLGILPDDQADESKLINRLLASEGSVNLFCRKA